MRAFSDSLTQSDVFRTTQWIPIKIGKEQKIFGANFMQLSITFSESLPLDRSMSQSFCSSNFYFFQICCWRRQSIKQICFTHSHLDLQTFRHSKGASEPLRFVLWQLKMSAVRRQVALKRSRFGSWRVVTQTLISSPPCCAQGCTEVSVSPGELGCQLSPCISHEGLLLKCDSSWRIFGKGYL